MADASASAAATSTSGLQANGSGTISFGSTAYSWIPWAVGDVMALFALAVWAKSRRKK